MRQPVRPRALGQGQALRLETLRKIARLLDSAVAVPGTSFRIGLDPILGVVPGLGDLVSPVFGLAILWQASNVGVPRIVRLRMIVNVAIDAVLGAVPLVGDLFDFAWKANVKNFALLERHAEEERRASAGDWLFMAITTGVVIAIAIIPFVIAGWIVSIISRRLF